MLGWVGVGLLGLINGGVLEDLLFITLMVPNAPASWDLTGDLFWIFTVPSAQLMALAVTGSLAWFIGMRDLKKLALFWICWTVARTVFLNFANNPPGDIAIYVVWIAFWCALIGALIRYRAREQAPGAIE